MTEQKFEDQKAALMAGARPFFVKYSYQGTTTRMLNEALDIAPGTLYYYFHQGKRGLLDAIIASGERWPEPPAWQLTQPQNLDGLEHQLVTNLAQVWGDFTVAEHYETIVLAVRERAILADEQVAWLSRRFEQMTVSLTTALISLQAPCTLAKDEAVAFAETVIALYQRVLLDQVLIASKPLPIVDFYQHIQPGIHLLVSGLEATV